MCSGPTINGGGLGGDKGLRDGNGNVIPPKTQASPGPIIPVAPGDMSNPFLIGQSLGRFTIPNPTQTSVGDLKHPNPFTPPSGLTYIGGR